MTAWQRERARAAPWFLLPALALLAVFVVWPMVRAAGWSFTSADLLAPERAGWLGAANYSELLGDARFRRAFGNTALFALMVVPVQTVLAFALALWVNRPEPALWIMLGAVPLNVLLAYALIYGAFGLPRLELLGAGIATTLVNLAMCVAGFWITYTLHPF